MDQSEWEKLSPTDKKVQLYLRQKVLLHTFLARGAISQAQHDKSLQDLTEKMEIDVRFLTDEKRM